MRSPKLLDQIRDKIRTKHYSIRTEQAYVDWITRFILFHDKKHPSELGRDAVAKYLTYLARDKKVAASTQNQALSAILFLYREVLHIPIEGYLDIERANKPEKIPVVFTKEEVKLILSFVEGATYLMTNLLYGSGLRLMECVRLRVKDIDFQSKQILVRDGKGFKDRVTMLPDKLVHPLKTHLKRVKVIYEKDLSEGFGNVYLPYALARKYPHAAREWKWQWVFPSKKRSLDPRSGIERRHHISESVLQRAVKKAITHADITKQGSCHTFRHSFATHSLENGYDISPVRNVYLEHSNILEYQDEFLFRLCFRK